MKNIFETALATGNFKKFTQAVRAAGLADFLSDEENLLTCFVPEDSAFDKLPEGAYEKLLEDKDRLRRVLKFHIIEGKYFIEDIMSLDLLVTLEGEELNIDLEENNVMIDDAMVISCDLDTTNGIIQVIDRVLIPVE